MALTRNFPVELPGMKRAASLRKPSEQAVCLAWRGLCYPADVSRVWLATFADRYSRQGHADEDRDPEWHRQPSLSRR